jgi:RHS repeat-associated protein
LTVYAPDEFLPCYNIPQAFGNIVEASGRTYNPIRYAGYQYDEETGLYYLNARMYDPKIARFLQEDTYLGDPSDPLSLNLYTYCSNNPLMYYDPSGHNYQRILDEWANTRSYLLVLGLVTLKL